MLNRVRALAGAAGAGRRPCSPEATVALDSGALRLLEYVAWRVTVAVGNNRERIAGSLGLSPEEFDRAAAELLEVGLVTQEPLRDDISRLAVTDAGLAALEQHRSRGSAPGRPWWKLW
jgi:DNA-binding MarR family transcriptional regulator